MSELHSFVAALRVGGVVMVPLLALALVAGVVILEKAFVFGARTQAEASSSTGTWRQAAGQRMKPLLIRYRAAARANVAEQCRAQMWTPSLSYLPARRSAECP